MGAPCRLLLSVTILISYLVTGVPEVEFEAALARVCSINPFRSSMMSCLTSSRYATTSSTEAYFVRSSSKIDSMRNRATLFSNSRTSFILSRSKSRFCLSRFTSNAFKSSCIPRSSFRFAIFSCENSSSVRGFPSSFTGMTRMSIGVRRMTKLLSFAFLWRSLKRDSSLSE